MPPVSSANALWALRWPSSSLASLTTCADFSALKKIVSPQKARCNLTDGAARASHNNITGPPLLPESVDLKYPVTWLLFAMVSINKAQARVAALRGWIPELAQKCSGQGEKTKPDLFILNPQVNQ